MTKKSNSKCHKVFQNVRVSLHPTPYTLHPTPFTLHPSPFTSHPTPYTLTPSLDTLHPTPLTLHSAPFTLLTTPQELGDRYCVLNDEMRRFLGSLSPASRASFRRRYAATCEGTTARAFDYLGGRWVGLHRKHARSAAKD